MLDHSPRIALTVTIAPLLRGSFGRGTPRSWHAIDAVRHTALDLVCRICPIQRPFRSGFPPLEWSFAMFRQTEETQSQQDDRARAPAPVGTIVTDKAHSYRRVIREINHRYDPRFDNIRRVDRKWRNNLMKSDHPTIKPFLGYQQSFRSLRSTKEILSGIETIRTNRRGHVYQ